MLFLIIHPRFHIKLSKLEACAEEEVIVTWTILTNLTQTEIGIHAYYPVWEIERNTDSDAGIEAAEAVPTHSIGILESFPRSSNIILLIFRLYRLRLLQHTDLP